ncbi:HD-GYP domain-containing protein [Ornithinimicrobium faecis]|uniref:HD domain-containing protein n=1 Tax=Ornithinimicrobium faecis TaxID=2934158 RepID=A0ABY4YQE1_9MICO|nr:MULTISPECIES: HD domain-containing phosphohydrolase [unclassified Ornithinimicrobium]USQ78829.1 HD domain-containing protein [Ornithinimicrobium sp. HY1793]
MQSRPTHPADQTSVAVAGYVTAVCLLALALGLVALQVGRPPSGVVVAVLTGLGILGSSLRERDLGPHLGVSVATVILAAALPLAGPTGAVIVGFLSYLGSVRSQRLRTRLFNAGMTGVVGGVGGLVYIFAGGVSPDDNRDLSPLDLLLRVAVPLVVGYVVMTLLNCLLIGGMARAVSGARVWDVALRTLRRVGGGYLTHALIAFLFVVLWAPVGVGTFSAVLILGPMFIAQWTLSRDAVERRSHLRTVRTIVAALEEANPYSAGHSARVAELCDRIAPRVGIDTVGSEALHYAALLHDIGLIAAAPRVPRASGPVDVDYLVTITTHPEAGVRMLEGIDFLGGAMLGVLHHHERMDGRGYPTGLSGEDIPLFARVIAAADAFDSLTTTRSYRAALDQDKALEVLRARTGTHLDAAVVEALAEALATRRWWPTVIEDDVRSVVGDAHDHDDPLVSDLYAEWSPDGEVTR